MIFRDEDHRKKYHEIICRMSNWDVYHASLAYLMALDRNIQGTRITDCFDFSTDSIKPGVLEEDWITGTDRRVLQLGFNLWNSTQKADVSDVFYAGDDLEFLLEAVRIRLGESPLDRRGLGRYN